MGKAYRMFTVSDGSVEEGASIEMLRLKAGLAIPVVTVGEKGRGRKLGVLPVAGIEMAPCPDRGRQFDSWSSVVQERQRCGRYNSYCRTCGIALFKGESGRPIHPNDKGKVPTADHIVAAELGETRSGRPKLIARKRATVSGAAMFVLRTPIGFRGGNSHTGDRAGWKCGNYQCQAEGDSFEAPEACPVCGAKGYYGPRLVYDDFPGVVVTKGNIAQGDAGRAGSGEQMIAIIPAGATFRTGYSGRRYGATAAHYYEWDGEELVVETAAEHSAGWRVDAAEILGEVEPSSDEEVDSEDDTDPMSLDEALAKLQERFGGPRHEKG